jgi:heterotetrameric sarcosine oxidase gamma subunit
MPVSAPDPRGTSGAAGGAGRAPPGLSIARCRADVVEVGAWRSRGAELAAARHAHGVTPPAVGRAAPAPGGLVVCVRPGRFLVFGAPATPGASAAGWCAALAACAGVVDLSAALVGWRLRGPSVGAVLARSCRIDLDPERFPPGCAAATPLAQVAATIVSLRDGVLLWTPATTARHLHEWLIATARPFGVGEQADFVMDDSSGRAVP